MPQPLARNCASAAEAACLPLGEAAPVPSRQQLYRHVLACAVPMVGFGFMDNLVMIQAGDLIDSTLGVTFGLSTLTAAAYGQVVSDVSGTLFGSTIDALAARLGLPAARLTHAQLQLRHVRLWGLAGAVTGVSLGCLLGMTSLLLMDLDRSERLKRQRELRTLFHTLMEEGHTMIGERSRHTPRAPVDVTTSPLSPPTATLVACKRPQPRSAHTAAAAPPPATTFLDGLPHARGDSLAQHPAHTRAVAPPCRRGTLHSRFGGCRL